MSYIDVGKEYEEKLLAAIKEDPEEGCIFPCFAESCTNDILQMRVNKRLEEVFDNPELNLPTVISIFGQYLFDTYQMNPEDIEFMCQVVIQGMFHEIEEAAATAAKLVDSGDVFTAMVNRMGRRNRGKVIDFPSNVSTSDSTKHD